MRVTLFPRRSWALMLAMSVSGLCACEDAATMPAPTGPLTAPTSDAGDVLMTPVDAGDGAMPAQGAGRDASFEAGVALDAAPAHEAGADARGEADADVEGSLDAAADAEATENAPGDAEAGAENDAGASDAADAAGLSDGGSLDAGSADADAAVGVDGPTGPPWPSADRFPGRQLALGRAHACSLDPAISGLLCWGDDERGQTDVPGLVEPSFVAAGGDVTCVIDRDEVRCWGDTSSGLLDVPPLPAAAIQVAVGTHHACVLMEDDAILCWGQGVQGQLSAPDLSEVQAIGVGDRHSCALAADGVHCWGDNSQGQLDVPPLRNPSALAVGATHGCAIAAGAVRCWGGSVAALREEVPTLKSPFAIAAGGSHSCAIDEGGVHCWGDAEAVDLSPPELTWPLQIAVGGAGSAAFACVRHLQGVACWGDDSLGQTAYDGSPLHRLHHSESTIEAPADLVWDVLMDLESYPLWNPYTIRMESTLQVGDPMVMTVRMNALVTLDAQTEHIRVLEPGHKVCWGIETDTPEQNSGERCQWLEPLSDTRTRYVTEDLIEGTLNPIVNALFDADVESGFDNVASSLKTRAEELYQP